MTEIKLGCLEDLEEDSNAAYKVEPGVQSNLNTEKSSPKWEELRGLFTASFTVMPGLGVSLGGPEITKVMTLEQVLAALAVVEEEVPL